MIKFVEEGVKSKLRNRRIIKSWIDNIVKSYGLKLGNLCYIFCNDDYILDVNRQYLQHDYYTDIITFDYSEDGIVSGDMFISVDTVLSNSQLFNSKYNTELNRVVIHGVLHLCGIKDKSDEDAKIMREAEDRALSELSRLIEIEKNDNNKES